MGEGGVCVCVCVEGGGWRKDRQKEGERSYDVQASVLQVPLIFLRGTRMSLSRNDALFLWCEAVWVGRASIFLGRLHREHTSDKVHKSTVAQKEFD